LNGLGAKGTVAKLLDGGALSLAGTRTPAMGTAAAPVLPPLAAMRGCCCSSVAWRERERENGNEVRV
jgi:hypothetical protein